MSTTAAELPFSNLARQANKIMDQMQKGFYVYSGETWTPNVNLYETADRYMVCVDLAGVEKEKIDVEVHDQRLRLRGNRVVPSHESDAGEHKTRYRIHLMEIDHGPFTREVELPADANQENITANYRSGLLWIEIPKVEAGTQKAEGSDGGSQ